MLFVPLIRCQRGPLDTFSPPVGLDSIVKPWFTDRGAAWSLLWFGAVFIASLSKVVCLETDIWR